MKPAGAPSWHDHESLIPTAAVAEHRKVSIQGSYPFDSQPLHERKARAVDQREILVLEVDAYTISNLQVSWAYYLERGKPRTNRVPKTLRCSPTQAMPKQEPGLDQDVVAGDQIMFAGQRLLRTPVAPIAAVGGRVPDRGVDERAQRLRAFEALRVRDWATSASPSRRSLSTETSVPPESPRSKIRVTSGRRERPARSPSTSLRTYSASEMPRAEDLARARRCCSGVRVI